MPKQMLNRTTWLLALALAVVGCGDDGAGGGTCKNFKACGGEIVGEWHVDSICFENPEQLLKGGTDVPECKGLVGIPSVLADGTYVFKKDGTASSDVTTSFTLDAHWTAKCIRALAKGATINTTTFCSRLEAEYATNGDFAEASCKVEGSDCNCMLTSIDASRSSSGKYTVDGNKLDFGGGDTSPFCVDGDSLKVSATDSGLTGVFSMTRK